MNLSEEQIKLWVTLKSHLTNPYKKYWSASVTLGGMDVNGTGNTIEKAYISLTKRITESPYLSKALQKLLSPFD